MVFDVSLPTRGFETVHILSDESHYGSFLCGTCDKMVSLDSVVTTTCHHPHCRKCIEGAAMKSFMRRKPSHCPTCDSNIEQQQQNSAPSQYMQFGPVSISVRPLPEAEPLAFQVLQRVRVSCSECDWQGEYCNFLNHALLHAFSESEQEITAVFEKEPERTQHVPATTPRPPVVIATVKPPPAAAKAPAIVVVGSSSATPNLSALGNLGPPPEAPKPPAVALAAAMPAYPAVAIVEEVPTKDGTVFADKERTTKEKDESIVAIEHGPLPLNGAVPLGAAAEEMQPDLLGQTVPQQIVVQEEKPKPKSPAPVPSFVPPPLSEQRKLAVLHHDPSPQSEAMLQSAHKNACIEIPTVVEKEDPKVSDIRSFWKVRENLQQELSWKNQLQQESDIPRMEMSSGDFQPSSLHKGSSNRNLVGSKNDTNEQGDHCNDTSTGPEGREGSIEGSQPTVLTSDSERCDSEKCKSLTTQNWSGRIIVDNVQPSPMCTKADKCDNQISVPSVVHGSTDSFEQSNGSIDQVSMSQSTEPVRQLTDHPMSSSNYEARGEAPLPEQTTKKADQKNESEPRSVADVVSRAEIETKPQVNSAGDRSENMDETQQIDNESLQGSRDMFVDPLDCDSFYESDLDIPDDDSLYEEVVEHTDDEDDDESMEDFQADVTRKIEKQNDSEDDVVCDRREAKQQRLMNASIDSLGFSDDDLNDDCDDGKENQQKNMDASIDSLGFSEEDLNTPFDGGCGDENDCEGGDGQAYAQIVKKAEKLKKQANAKFNKSDLNSAQTLYSKGIKILETSPLLLVNEHTLLSGMYANRAVTYYRQKHFQEAIDDCESAIKYNPSEDKAWIRKWRAMMALGECEEAFAFIQKGLSEVPDSKKIEQECQKSSAEMAAHTKVKALMEIGDIKQAKHVLGGVMDSSENLFLLILAARVDTALGGFESALEKIDRSLKINPNYADALELRGLMHFIQGETKTALDFLQDACDQNKENVQLKAALRRVQRTHVMYSDARAAVNDGQYKEAIEKFSTAIRESNPLPPVAPLYAMLRTERAESNLLRQQYVPALKDCHDVTSVCPNYAQAWVVRAKVLVALGKVKDAKKELDKVRRQIGTENNLIEECYQDIDFELRVGKVDGDLLAFQNELENGICSRLPSSENNRSLDPRMISSDHSIQLPGRNFVPMDSVLPQHNSISYFDISEKAEDKRLSESAHHNHEWKQRRTASPSTPDSVIDEEAPTSFKDTASEQSDRDLRRRDKDGSSRHRGNPSRDSFKAPPRDDIVAGDRKDRGDKERRRRDDRRRLSGPDQSDRSRRNDGDRWRSDDRSRPNSSREDRDRRVGYSRSGSMSRNHLSSKRGDTDRSNKRDSRREGDRRRSDDRVGTRRSDRPVDEKRRNSRPEVSSRRSSKIDNSCDRLSGGQQSSWPHPSREEPTGHSKHSSRRASMSGNGGRDGGSHHRGGSDSINPNDSNGRHQRRSSTFT